MMIPAQVQVFTTSGSGSGILALPISFAGVSNSQIRFGNAFDEFRILAASVKIVPLTSSTGMTKFFWSEKTITTPLTASNIQQKITRDIQNSNGAGNGSAYVMRYKSDGFADLDWQPIGFPNPIAYFYAFTDPAYSTTALAQNIFLCTVTLDVQLRGMGFV